jgi:hypothetical protein
MRLSLRRFLCKVLNHQASALKVPESSPHLDAVYIGRSTRKGDKQDKIRETYDLGL